MTFFVLQAFSVGLLAPWQARHLFLMSSERSALFPGTLVWSIPWGGALVGGSVVLMVILAGCMGGLAWQIVLTITQPKKRDHRLPITPDALGLPAEAVSFPCRGDSHQVRGLYIPAAGARSTILLCPGYRRSLSDLLVTCHHLLKAGHNVLAFEFYGHGLPTGSVLTLGYRELEDVFGAVTYARRRAPTARLGAMGYSMGAATVIMAAARTPQIEAIVADSGFATQWSAVELAVRRTLQVPLPGWVMRVLYQVADRLLWLRAGYHFRQVEPAREIGQIAPRPLLLIHGLSDSIVAPFDAQRLYEAAAEPKELWLIPACEHLRGYVVKPAVYAAKVTAFFEPLKTVCPVESLSLPCVSSQRPALLRCLSMLTEERSPWVWQREQEQRVTISFSNRLMAISIPGNKELPLCKQESLLREGQ